MRKERITVLCDNLSREKKRKAEKKEPGSFEGRGQKRYDTLFDPSKYVLSTRFIPNPLQREFYAILYGSVSVLVDINWLGKLSSPSPLLRVPKLL